MIRALLFDLDGTLHDRDTSVRQLIRQQYQRFYTIWAHVPAESYLARFIELDARGYTPKDAVYAQLGREFNLTASTAQALETDFFDQYAQHTVGFPSLYTVLEQLRQRGIKLGLITNGRTAIQQRKIAVMVPEPYFDTILISEAEGLRKPDAQISNEQWRGWPLAPPSRFMWAIPPQVDVVGAQNTGLRAVWKRDLYWSDCPSADWVIDDLAQLLQICQ